MAQRLRSAVELEVFYPEPDTRIQVTISIGVTEHIIGEGINPFIQRADQAMYESKEKGRNNVSIHFK